MNILLINHYAGSPAMGMEYRPYYMAREWTKAGHHVTIVAANNAHVRTIQPRTKHKFQEEIIDGITYLWVKTPAYHGNGFKRILNMFCFYKKVKRAARKLALKYNPDAVIASSTYPMDNYAACKIARIAKAKYFFEVHDLWPLSPMELGGYKASHPFIKYLQHAEDFAYKHVDGVISMLPKTLEYMQSRGLDPGKWHFVPNGINTAEWNQQEPIPIDLKLLLQKIKSDFDFIVAYTGSIGIANALDSFIAAAALMKDFKTAFIIVGKGPEKQQLINSSHKLNNVFFFESVKKSQIPDLLSYFDVLYIGLQRQSLFRFGVSPNKIFDYMMAGKPVLQAIEAGNDIVADAKCGITVMPENPEAIASALREYLCMSIDDRNALGKSGQAYVLRNHDYKILAAKFIDILSANSKSDQA
ncbi:MAG: glycosyltransferase WbuB [Bacteroidetes bacterium GWF2_43_63]|nr:MAG: glycosyltransferase WbuB [Bacteroidetes bacterium GWE2_42_42]OFY55763.1 MAG: glycosyltransferase WbuB [Bacteroidetes bacterium GWF2_43_63]HBG71321.1 glycosyltransferase WbuB [Bacteroidales bacterium]HCB60458.1 glycosyltransferase WbuB [Bacteroidales bacterium]HCY22585.1 glycosyltransferase WbuB [Bacteroidales bacterium]